MNLPTLATAHSFMAKILLSLSVLFLTLSAVFGVLNTNKARTLREAAVRADTEQAEAQQVTLAKEKAFQAREAKLAAAAAQSSQTEDKLGAAEAQLIKSQTDKAALQAKLQAHEAEIVELRKRVEGVGAKDSASTEVLPMPGSGDLETQLEDTRRQLEAAEREKKLLASRLPATPDHPGNAPASGRRTVVARPSNPGIRGSILAVNQAYNFVVLNLGGRQGLEANAEMLVLRRGSLIGKIRVSSVEPATAIGDIVTTSLARGVQVQPGDVVIYAAPNS
ncbi:MAG: hypothetical protein ABI946_00110 [Chthoniobacterales bacterium]